MIWKINDKTYWAHREDFYALIKRVQALEKQLKDEDLEAPKDFYGCFDPTYRPINPIDRLKRNLQAVVDYLGVDLALKETPPESKIVVTKRKKK